MELTKKLFKVYVKAEKRTFELGYIDFKYRNIGEYYIENNPFTGKPTGYSREYSFEEVEISEFQICSLCDKSKLSNGYSSNELYDFVCSDCQTDFKISKSIFKERYKG